MILVPQSDHTTYYLFNFRLSTCPCLATTDCREREGEGRNLCTPPLPSLPPPIWPSAAAAAATARLHGLSDNHSESFPLSSPLRSRSRRIERRRRTHIFLLLLWIWIRRIAIGEGGSQYDDEDVDVDDGNGSCGWRTYLMRGR